MAKKTKAELESWAEELGLDISSAKNNKEREALINEFLDDFEVDETLIPPDDPELEPYIEERTEPMDLTEQDIEALNEKEKWKREDMRKNYAEAIVHDNGVNRWRLITSFNNDRLGIKRELLAMKLRHGVLTMVSDALHTKVSVTTCFIPGGDLVQDKHDNWVLK